MIRCSIAVALSTTKVEFGTKRRTRQDLGPAADHRVIALAIAGEECERMLGFPTLRPPAVDVTEPVSVAIFGRQTP